MSAAPAGYEPWLFERHGWDWRWLSWGEAAAKVEALGTSLAASTAGRSEPSGGFDWRPSVASVTAHLALTHQAGIGRAFGAGGFLWPDEVEGVAPVIHAEAAAGDVGLLASGLEGGEEWAAALELAGRLGSGSERDISVLGSRLDQPLGRLLLAWSLATGAALVLEGQRDAYLPTAFWARPTVLAVSTAELESLTQDLRRLRQGKRSPLGRLQALLVEDSSSPLAEPWRARGVAVVPLPR